VLNGGGDDGGDDGGGGGGGGGGGARYRNKQEVAELAWFLLYKAVAKGSAFISGAWIIEDAGYALFDALSPLCYSRKMYGSSPRNFATYPSCLVVSYFYLLTTTRLRSLLHSLLLPPPGTAPRGTRTATRATARRSSAARTSWNS
jgi:hypothetical protein